MGVDDVWAVVDGFIMVGISGVGFGITGIPPATLALSPVWLKPANVASQSLFGSCCLRNAANSSSPTIAGACGAGVCYGFHGLGGCASTGGRTSWHLSPVVEAGFVEAGLWVAFFFPIV